MIACGSAVQTIATAAMVMAKKKIPGVPQGWGGRDGLDGFFDSAPTTLRLRGWLTKIVALSIIAGKIEKVPLTICRAGSLCRHRSYFRILLCKELDDCDDFALDLEGDVGGGGFGSSAAWRAGCFFSG